MAKIRSTPELRKAVHGEMDMKSDGPPALTTRMRGKLSVGADSADNHHLSVISSSHRKLIFFSVSNMSQPSSSSSFQTLFDAALQDYENQTGNSLVDHPFARQLEECDSVDSVAAILQEQSRGFREFRGGDGNLMKSVMRSVDVLYTLSVSTILGEGIGLVRPKVFISVPCSSSLLFSHSRLRKQYLLVSPSYSPYVSLSDSL